MSGKAAGAARVLETKPADLGPVSAAVTGNEFACAIQAATLEVRCWGARFESG